ncbi:uncharacterized protein DS421_17g599760 [Arachis hypogaea]|nr:uncharacterized protein DS421_17g599760 [Arachis hypogaea]
MRSAGFKNWFLVELDGMVGGMVLAWKEDVKIKILQSDWFYIVARIGDLILAERWGLIGVCLSTNKQIRYSQFTHLQTIIQQFNSKVVVVGDFNAILCQAEKQGDNDKSQSSITNFGFH